MYSNIILQESKANKDVKEDSSQQEQCEQQPEKDSSEKTHIETLKLKINYISVKLEQRILHILNTLLVAWILVRHNINE